MHVTTRESSDACLSCDCPNLIEVKLKIKACKCKKNRPLTNGENVAAAKEEKPNNFADKICECLNRSKSRSNFLKIDFVDGHLSDPESLENGVVDEKRRRNVLVLKLKDLDVKCENGLRHELYFPASAMPGKFLSQGDCLAYSMSSTGDIHEHKPIPVPEDLTSTEAISEEKQPKQVRKPVERQISKSMDDVKKDKTEKPLKCRSAQNVAEGHKGRVAGATGREENSMSDMDSIELIIISDEFLNESQNHEVIIVNEEKKPTRSKSFQIKKNFLHDSRTNGSSGATGGKDRGDYFKRAAEAKAKAAQMASGAAGMTGGKRLVIISDEYKRKSMESTVKIVKSKEKLSTKTTTTARKSLAGMAKGKTISNAMVDLNSKIISCVLQSYEEPDSLENKALEAKLLQEQLLAGGKGRMVHPILTPNK